MFSTFNENTSVGQYSWGVLILLAILFVVIFYNFHLFTKEVEEHEKRMDEDSRTLTKEISLLNVPGFLRHVALIVLTTLVLLYGYGEIQNDKSELREAMISSIEKDNGFSELKVLDENPEIVCQDDYVGSINAAIWQDKTGKEKMGLLIGQKDLKDSTCRFAVKDVNE